MSIYYKFKSAKAFDSITIEGQFISVGNLKERIFESKHLGRGTDFDLMVSNAQTNEEYLDEAAMIPKNTSVLIRRLPGRPRMPIVTQPDLPKNAEHMAEDVQPPSSMLVGNSSAAMTIADESEWDEFGGDLYAIPEVVPDQLANPVVDVSSASKIDEENKIKSLIETSALDWSGQSQDGYGGGRGFGRGMGGRMMAGRGFGRGGFERKIPPAGYVCYRCKIPGHLIQHCPTNGDPNYDVRKVKPPTGIPKSMLMATPDGSYALPSGAVAVLQPNEAAFEKEIEGMPSTRPACEIPPELRCPFCKELMKDAVLTGTCCFRSFCDKCIREYIISKSMCVCGATNILADDLLPNKTLRETISRILESTTSSTENVGNVVQVQDMESAHQMLSKNSSPTLSVPAKDEPKMTPDHSLQVKIGDVEEDAAPSDEGKAVRVNDTAHSLKKNTVHSMEQKSMTGTDHFEATPELTNGKNPLSPKISSVPEVQEKLPVGEQGKKKKKKASLPGSAADMQWRGIQDLGPETYGGMHMGPSAYNPYWGGGMPMGMDAYMTPLAPAMPYMGYAPGPFNVPFGGMLPPQQYAAQGFMMGSFPPGDISKQGFNSMSMNNGPPMSKQEFEAMKDNIRRKQKFEWEMHNERERYRDGRGVTGKEVSHSRVDVSPRKSKPRIVAERTERPPLRHQENHLHRQHSPSPSRRRSPPPSAPKQRTLSSERYGDNDETRREDRSKTNDQNQNRNHREKASVFTRINLLNSEDSSDRETKNRKRKVSSSSDVSAAGPDHGGSTKDRYDSHHHCRSTHHRHEYDAGAANNGYKMNGDDEEEEEEYHFKRRPSSSSSRREERRSSRVSKEGDRRWH